MPLSLGHSPWLLALAASAAGALTWWTYRRSATPALSNRRRALLGGLRFGALALVLFLLFEPVWRQISEEETPPSVAVLMDESQSLRVTAAASGSTGTSPSSAAGNPRPAVRRALEGVTGGALAEARLRIFGFSEGPRRLPDAPGRALDSLRFDGPRTNLSAALRRAREQLRGENLRAIVLISDGQYNAGRNPLYQAARSPVPIHTVVVGDTSRRRDVVLRRAEANDLAYTDTRVPVRVGVQSSGGFAGQKVQVSLWDGGERLARRPLTLAEGSATQTVELAFTPQEAGLRRLTASVARLDGEATYRNNTQPVSLRVLEQKRQVLLLGAAPSPGVSAVRRLLEADPAAEVTARVSRGAGRFYGGALPDSLADAFDVAVLAGFPGKAAGAPAARRVSAAVEDGLPALFLMHPQTDLRALQKHFSGVLPARPEQIRSSTVQATFAPTAAGRRHPVLENLQPGSNAPSASGSAWTRLPPLRQSQTRWQLAPDARPLATARVRGMDTGTPLLVTRRRAGQRSGVLLGSGTWRWANLPQALEGASSLWPRLLSNLVQWTSAVENDQPVRVEPASPTFAGGEAVRLTGQVYDSALDPVEDASVEITLTGESAGAPPNDGDDSKGKRYSFQMQSLGEGRYALDAPALPPGRYEYEATAQKDGQTLGTDQGAFAVGRSRREFRRPRANAALMRQIAGRSGGSFHPAVEAGALPGRVAAAGLAPRVERTPQETPLWERYGSLVAALLLLGAEWVLRRRSGMA